MKVTLSKGLGLLLAMVCIWVVGHLWIHLAWERNSEPGDGCDNDKVIWKLNSAARESSSIISLLRDQQAGLERISQQLRLLDRGGDGMQAETKQDCSSCNKARSMRISSSLNYASFLSSSQLDTDPLTRVGLGLAGYRLVLGIPTVNRGESYLLRTLRSLLSPQELAKERKALFIVFVAEMDNSTYCQSIIDEVQQHHPTELREGVLEVVCPNPKFYPPLGHLPQTLSDPPERVRWRSKQVVDFSLLMLYAAQKGDYYIQLEDDIVASKGYLQHILSYVDSSHDEWVFVHFSTLGFIGKLFKVSDLTGLAEYFLFFYFRQPVDWLLVSYMRDIICNYFQNDKECYTAIAAYSPVFTPSLFQHIGTTSSLKGKTQDLVDGFYNKDISTIASRNVPALLSSSLPIEQSHIPSMAYSGQGIMWSNNVRKDDFLLISLFHPQPLTSIQVITGSQQAPNDVLRSGLIEYSRVYSNGTEQYFSFLCQFVDGSANCDFPSHILISKVRVTVTQDQTQWLLISEITVQTDNSLDKSL